MYKAPLGSVSTTSGGGSSGDRVFQVPVFDPSGHVSPVEVSLDSDVSSREGRQDRQRPAAKTGEAQRPPCCPTGHSGVSHPSGTTAGLAVSTASPTVLPIEVTIPCLCCGATSRVRLELPLVSLRRDLPSEQPVPSKPVAPSQEAKPRKRKVGQDVRAFNNVCVSSSPETTSASCSLSAKRRMRRNKGAERKAAQREEQVRQAVLQQVVSPSSPELERRP